MNEPTAKVQFETDWEDCECALVTTLVCSCGTNLLEGYTDYTVSHEEIKECPKCKAKYQFIWKGMTIEKVK